MEEPSSDDLHVDVAVGVLFPAVIALLALFTPEIAQALGWFFVSVTWICVVWFAMSFLRLNFALRSYAARNSPEGIRLAQLRADLEEGGKADIVYRRWLEACLHKLEKFFGERSAPAKNSPLFLREYHPIWTEPGLDRCFYLALVYPVMTILIVWTLSGHVGPAEVALQLPAGADSINPQGFPLAKRILGIAMFGGAVFCLSWGLRAITWKLVLSLVPAFILLGGVIVFWNSYNLILTIGAICCMMVLGSPGPETGGISGIGSVVGAAMIICAPVLAIKFGTPIGMAIGALLLLAFIWLDSFVFEHQWHRKFLIVCAAGLLAACFFVARSAANLYAWPIIGPGVLFLIFLTLLNAPFDWVAIGVTRILLWRGIELEFRLAPYCFAFLDAGFAVLVVVALSVTMVLGIQFFNLLAEHGGGDAAVILPLTPLFDGMVSHPGNPEYFWAYALLLSTMLPSVINLAIGGASLIRGWSRIAEYVLNLMPEGRPINSQDRLKIAVFLSAESTLGVAFALVAQAFLLWGFLFHVLPLLGTDLLGPLRAVADLNLPLRFVGWLNSVGIPL